MPVKYSDSPAIRKDVPLFFAASGGPGSGKTFSLYRIAEGARSVVGGSIHVLDTESGRGMHYVPADGEKPIPGRLFDIVHHDFSPPYSPSEYLAAVQELAKRNAGVIILDSASPLHDSEGGTLRAHEAELDRLAGNDFQKRERVKFLAWVKPKAELDRFIEGIKRLRFDGHAPIILFAFKAKEKLRIVRGKEPEDMGWTPIGSPELLFEMTASVVLPPNSRGVPNIRPAEPGHALFTKIPIQFEHFLRPGQQLDEELGRKMAMWARGGHIEMPPPTSSVPAPASAPDRAALLAEIKAVLKASFPGKGKSVFEQVFNCPFDREAGMSVESLLFGLRELKAMAGAAQTPARVPIVDSGPVSGQLDAIVTREFDALAQETVTLAGKLPAQATLDGTRSVASIIRDAASAAGLSEEALLRICKGDPEEVPDSPEILEEILDKIRKETS